jgi:hypothetical protein
VLRKAQVPEDLISLWLGHARTLTDRYFTQLRENEQYRGEWCAQAGLGFSVVPLFHNKVVSIGAAMLRELNEGKGFERLGRGRVDLNHRPPGPEPRIQKS